ncbi:hypothetical protein L209DRAFT_757745, partial [Thermothelomyces heterothallicus CBS 203.75]
MPFVCLHFSDYTCTNTVGVKDTLCSECEAGKCGQSGISCSKNRALYRSETTTDTSTDTSTTTTTTTG